MHHVTLVIRSGMMTGSILDSIYIKKIQDHIDCMEGYGNSLINTSFNDFMESGSVVSSECWCHQWRN
jgi:hypothetical protein